MESGEKYLSSEELLLRLEKVDWKDVTLKLKAYSLLRIKQHSKIVTDELINVITSYSIHYTKLYEGTLRIV